MKNYEKQLFFIFFRILIYPQLGNFSITGIEISFIRHKFKYIYVYYLPSGLFVVVSWVSFLIPPEVIPGRMAMLITLFLVLINIFNVSRMKNDKSKNFYPCLIGYAWLKLYMINIPCR